MGRRVDDGSKRVGRHLLVTVARRCLLDLITQQEEANRQQLAGQHERRDESDERKFHARSGI